MPINNPAGEQHEEQLRMHAEALGEEREQIIAQLDEILGKGGYTIDHDGSVVCKLSDLELSKANANMRIESEKRLQQIAAELKRLGR